MPIRQITSRSVKDGEIAQADFASSVTFGAGYFQGENGAVGDTSSGKGDIFRVNESTLNTSVTIASGDNASCASFDGINFWNCKPYSQRKSDDCIGDREWHQH